VNIHTLTGSEHNPSLHCGSDFTRHSIHHFIHAVWKY